MKGDFTRDTFDPRKHYSRVLMQQGRVQLDADWNEQVAILLHYLQTLAADLIGPHGGPGDVPDPNDDTKTLKVNCGFEIIATEARIDNLLELAEGEKTRLKELLRQSKPPLLLGKGHYYVGGVLAENPEYMAYPDQKGYPFPGVQLDSNQTYLLYLDVWERHLTYVEVEDAEGIVVSMREVALGGPDTATRAQVVWQVKAWSGIGARPDAAKWKELVNGWQPENRGKLKARAIKAESADPEDPCITPPESRYRGAENQLYRVEIHKGGTADGGATFKWSRENGSVIFPIDEIGEGWVKVKDLGRDARLGLQPDDWVEIVDDDYTLQNRAEPLLQVETIDPDTNVVTLKDNPASAVGQDDSKHPLLRRWDQREAENSLPSESGVQIVEGQEDQNWIELEDGVQIQFQPGATYRTGDYWQIPARTATGDAEWPGPVGNPDALPPHGVQHYYAPICWISVGGDGTVTGVTDCRRQVTKAVDPELYAHVRRTDNPHQVTAAQIGALAVSDYDLRQTQYNAVLFSGSDGNGAQRTIPLGFQPMLVLAMGGCSALLGQKRYGGTVAAIASFRDGMRVAQCSGVDIVKWSAEEVSIEGWGAIGLFSSRFQDLTLGQPPKGELLEIQVNSLSSTGFTVKLVRTLPVGFLPLDEFSIKLDLFCLG
jgi:hypothetical protein